MTNHPNDGSAIQTRDSESDAVLDSTSPSNTSPISHSFNPRHLKHAHHHHHHHIRRCHKRRGIHDSHTEHSKEDTNRQKVSSDSHSLGTPEPIIVDANVYARADTKPFVTRVVQTISLIQIVDHSGKPIRTQTHRGVPNTVVVDVNSGITISASNPDPSKNAVLPLPGVGNKASGDVTSTSTHLTITQSSSSSIPTSSSSDTTSSYPTLSDVHNGTHPLTANNTMVPSNSTFKPFVLSASSSASNSTRYRMFSHSSSSKLTDISATLTSTTTSDGFDGTITAVAAPTSSSSSSSSSSGSGTTDLSPQQKQVIGGVVGGLAGAAVFALLLLLVLRWKRKRDNLAALSDEDTGSSTTRALPGVGGDSSGPYGSMSERAAGSAAVMGALASLTGRKPQTAAAAGPSTGERGFYRVSGRKLPSVLTAGGDGYTDPRESAMSDNSNYSDNSQSSEPMDPRSAPYALGTPMRPISGVPIMRSGPARTPVQESNPFADPSPSPFADPRPAPPVPSPPRSSPARSLGQRESPRMSGSRFQERI